jgi:hypothetical protein
MFLAPVRSSHLDQAMSWHLDRGGVAGIPRNSGIRMGSAGFALRTWTHCRLLPAESTGCAYRFGHLAHCRAGDDAGPWSLLCRSCRRSLCTRGGRYPRSRRRCPRRRRFHSDFQFDRRAAVFLQRPGQFGAAAGVESRAFCGRELGFRAVPTIVVPVGTSEAPSVRI